MELEIKTVPVEVKGFKPGEVAKLTYDTKTMTIADIAVVCAICDEETPMNSNDYRARGVFICDKCKAAIMHIRNILEKV